VAKDSKGKGKQQMPAGAASSDRRLIEEWLPIAALSEESIRERRSMTALPPTYYLHVWWARRPLVASRAAVLASLLPADADRDRFLHMLGIHGDPVAAKKRIEQAARNANPETGKREDLGANPYGYPRAFSYGPSGNDLTWLREQSLDGHRLVLDPTAGGGSIPFEAARSGCDVIANDLNPVAWLVLKTTVDFPVRFGWALADRYQKLSERFLELATPRFEGVFKGESLGTTVDAYLWARTITCPYCGGVVPLSPNWRLSSKGDGVRLMPHTVDGNKRYCQFEIVQKVEHQSEGTVDGGDGKCPFPDCGRVIEGDEIKRQAQAGQMGEQLYAVAFREQLAKTFTVGRRARTSVRRGFRPPSAAELRQEGVVHMLEARRPEWEASNVLPDEEIDAISNYDRGHRMYGMCRWVDFFSARQLVCHGIIVESFRDLMQECSSSLGREGIDEAALSYICLAIDKLLGYNSRYSQWIVTRGVVAPTFSQHNFAVRWSYAEMPPAGTGKGIEWAVQQTGKALNELISLATAERRPSNKRQPKGLFDKSPVPTQNNKITITCGSGDNLVHIANGSVDVVVMDPPYYDNVMYAELSDYYYVWLKRTAGLLFPEQFSSYLTDKDREAVANSAKFKDFSRVKGSGGVKRRASKDYQERMQAIFAECRRVLKRDGLMTLMFTHKATGAWDALAKGLVEAGFVITASWPISTEAESSLHIKDKNAAKSTIFLVCRPRQTPATEAETTYWEDVEPLVKDVVLARVEEFEKVGMRGVDLYLSCFGPALQVFSTHWPMIRGRPAPKPMPARGAQFKLIEEEEWDPYAVRPEDALMAARAAVKEWRLDRIAQVKRQAHLDPVTEFFVLAWDAFESPQFPADEALKLSRVVGVNFDEQLRGHILEVKGGDVIIWDSGTRAKKGTIGSVKGGAVLNALHLAAKLGREQNTGAAKDLIERAELLKDQTFLLSLDAVLNVLPTPTMVAGSSVVVMQGAAADADALEKLRQLVFSQDIPQPKPWMLFDPNA